MIVIVDMQGAHVARDLFDYGVTEKLATSNVNVTYRLERREAKNRGNTLSEMLEYVRDEANAAAIVGEVNECLYVAVWPHTMQDVDEKDTDLTVIISLLQRTCRTKYLSLHVRTRRGTGVEPRALEKLNEDIVAGLEKLNATNLPDDAHTANRLTNAIIAAYDAAHAETEQLRSFSNLSDAAKTERSQALRHHAN